jgi:hypothetical protein
VETNFIEDALQGGGSCLICLDKPEVMWEPGVVQPAARQQMLLHAAAVAATAIMIRELSRSKIGTAGQHKSAAGVW